MLPTVKFRQSSDSAMTSQEGENVLDNVGYESFCDSEEIRVAFF